MNIHQDLRKRLHVELKRTHISQVELSRCSGIDAATINHLLHGNRVGRIQTWQRLFDALSEIPSALTLFDTGS